jgi:hypothetical protein
VSGDKASRSGWSAALLGALAVACCLATPALAGVLGGAVVWGVGLPVALALAVALAGGCFALMTALRRRRRSAP